MGYKKITSISDIGGGVAEEQFNRSLNKVIENIEDPATEPTNVRKITLEITIKPDKDRGVAKTEVKCSEKLAPVRTDEVTVLIERDDKGEMIMKSKEPEKQLELDLGESNVQ